MSQDLPSWLGQTILTNSQGKPTATAIYELPLPYSGPSIVLTWPWVPAEELATATVTLISILGGTGLETLGVQQTSAPSSASTSSGRRKTPTTTKQSAHTTAATVPVALSDNSVPDDDNGDGYATPEDAAAANQSAGAQSEVGPEDGSAIDGSTSEGQNGSGTSDANGSGEANTSGASSNASPGGDGSDTGDAGSSPAQATGTQIGEAGTSPPGAAGTTPTVVTGTFPAVATGTEVGSGGILTSIVSTMPNGQLTTMPALLSTLPDGDTTVMPVTTVTRSLGPTSLISILPNGQLTSIPAFLTTNAQGGLTTIISPLLPTPVTLSRSLTLTNGQVVPATVSTLPNGSVLTEPLVLTTLPNGATMLVPSVASGLRQDNGLSGGQITGITLGAVAASALLGLLIACLILARRRKKRRADEPGKVGRGAGWQRYRDDPEMVEAGAGLIAYQDRPSDETQLSSDSTRNSLAPALWTGHRSSREEQTSPQGGEPPSATEGLAPALDILPFGFASQQRSIRVPPPTPSSDDLSTIRRPPLTAAGHSSSDDSTSTAQRTIIAARDGPVSALPTEVVPLSRHGSSEGQVGSLADPRLSMSATSSENYTTAHDSLTSAESAQIATARWTAAGRVLSGMGIGALFARERQTSGSAAGPHSPRQPTIAEDSPTLGYEDGSRRSSSDDDWINERTSFLAPPRPPRSPQRFGSFASQRSVSHQIAPAQAGESRATRRSASDYAPSSRAGNNGESESRRRPSARASVFDEDETGRMPYDR